MKTFCSNCALISPLLAALAFTGCATARPLTDPYGSGPLPLPYFAQEENITLASTDWKDAGTDSPEHTLETFLWAARTGNTTRQSDVTYVRNSYAKAYRGASVEAWPNVSFDAPMTFTSTQIENNTADLTDDERRQTYALWLKPYVRGALAGRNLGTPDSPIPFKLLELTELPTPVHATELPTPKSALKPEDHALLYQFKPMLDVTILANKALSNTEVELDVREHLPARDGHPDAYFYVPCDFQLINGESWKLIIFRGLNLVNPELLNTPPKPANP
jgi:hypothetical protein